MNALYENDGHADDSDCPADFDRNEDSWIVESLDAGNYTMEATTYNANATSDFTLVLGGIGAGPAPP